MDNLVEILVPLGVAVALPVCIVSIIFRSAMAADRNRKEIILAALEKNPNLNVEAGRTHQNAFASKSFDR